MNKKELLKAVLAGDKKKAEAIIRPPERRMVVMGLGVNKYFLDDQECTEEQYHSQPKEEQVKFKVGYIN